MQIESDKPEAPTASVASSILRTRFVVGLEHKVDYQIFSLTNPNRVIVELPDINVRLPTLEENKSVGLVKSIRAGLAAPGKTRIVIDVTQPVIVESSKIAQDKDGQFNLALIIRPANAGLNNSTQKDFAVSPFALGAGGYAAAIAAPCRKPRGARRKGFQTRSSCSIQVTAAWTRAP